jgi:hypothetical protein
VTKEAKEQLADLQSKLEMANIGKEKKKLLFQVFSYVKFIKRNDGKKWKNSNIRKRD